MQTETQLRRSAAASLKLAKESTGGLHLYLRQLQLGTVEPRTVMTHARRLLENINKGLHEFSAYHNAANT